MNERAKWKGQTSPSLDLFIVEKRNQTANLVWGNQLYAVVLSYTNKVSREELGIEVMNATSNSTICYVTSIDYSLSKKLSSSSDRMLK